MPEVIQIVGYKNSGKTSLITYLVTRLKQENWKVGVIKHDSHDFEIEKTNTDTWKMQQAGSEIIAITSQMKTAIMYQIPFHLDSLIDYMREVDIILVEGFKKEKYPKIVIGKENEKIDLRQLKNIVLFVDSISLLSNEKEIKEKVYSFLLTYLKERRR